MKQCYYITSKGSQQLEGRLLCDGSRVWIEGQVEPSLQQLIESYIQSSVDIGEGRGSSFSVAQTISKGKSILDDFFDTTPIVVDKAVLEPKIPEVKESSWGRKGGGRRKKPTFWEPFEGVVTPISQLEASKTEIIIEGELLKPKKIEQLQLAVRETANWSIVSGHIADGTNGIKFKVFFQDKEEANEFVDKAKSAKKVRAKGTVDFDQFDKDYVLSLNGLMELPSGEKRTEKRDDSRVELHLHTKMSDKDGLIDMKDLIKTVEAWNHPAVAITDHGVVQAFPAAYQLSKGKNIKIIYGVEAYLVEGPDTEERHHIIILAKNQMGLRNLYKLISLSHLQYFKRRPRLPRSVIEDHREGLIIGSACEAGELFRALVRGENDEKLKEIASFYDYLEIQPLSNNMFLIRRGLTDGIEGLRDWNRKIVSLGEELDIPVVATCDAHFLNPEDKVYREVLLTATGFADAKDGPDLYLRTTDEMLEEFSYLGEEKAYEVVVTNTRAINDSIERIIPIPEGTYAPKIEGADEELRRMCYEKAHHIYGNPLPEIVKERLDYELKSIIGHGFGVLYYIAHLLVGKSLKEGYLVGSRGSVGSSFVATMADITEVNPLPPHYICPSCQYSEFVTDGSYAGGFDLPRKDCPTCGHVLDIEGHDIPFAIFMGFDGDKVPDIDLNFSGEYQPNAHKYTEELFGRDNVFRAGTIGTLAEKTAIGYARKFGDVNNMVGRDSFYASKAAGIVGIKNTTGQHPGGIMVCPRDMDVHHFTPIQYPANKKDSGIITTHFDYHSIEGKMTKLDILGHDDPTIIRMLEDLTGVDAKTIPFDEPETLKLFYSTESLGLTPEDLQGDVVGTLGIPEFNTSFTRGMLRDSKPSKFSDLVRISGFSHGTDVWLNNAQSLITSGVCTVSEAISTRDDIMNYLMQRQIEPLVSFKIMENVRKGKGIDSKNKQGVITTNFEETLRGGNIPEWFIESCQKIQYLFPRAHAVAYVMMAFRIAWFKLNHPLAFYASFFSIRAKAFDVGIMVGGLAKQLAEYERIKAIAKQSPMEENLFASLEVSMEMYKRGYEFIMVDIKESDATRFRIVDGKLLPPFTSIAGLGETVAESIVRERELRPFSSVNDVKRRCKVSQTILADMMELGCFGELPEDEQMSLF